MVVDPGDRHLAAEAGVLEQRGRDDEPPLTVELALAGAGEVMPLHAPCVLAERVERGDPLDQFLPLRTRIRGEAAVELAREDDALLEGCAELGRQREAVLVVEGMLMFTEQHGPLPPP